MTGGGGGGGGSSRACSGADTLPVEVRECVVIEGEAHTKSMDMCLCMYVWCVFVCVFVCLPW